MKQITLKDINLLDVGTKYMCVGLLWIGNEDSFISLLPDWKDIPEPMAMELSLEDWEKLLFQMDVIETEMFNKDNTGKLVKSIVRRSQRVIEGFVQWAVFKRDNYTCRYCGVSGVPLTVDHIITWETGGPSIIDNLLTACKKCNKVRGNQEYQEWINSELYKTRSISLNNDQLNANLEILNLLPQLEKRRYQNVRSR